MPRAPKNQGAQAPKRPPKQHFKHYRDNAPCAFGKMQQLFAQEDAAGITEVKDYTLLEDKKTVVCNPCSKSFYDKSTYDRHFRHTIEHSSIRVTCPDCEKTFGQKDSFLAHYCIYHSREYPFNCPKCCAKFQAPYQKSEHWCGDKHTKMATAGQLTSRTPIPTPIDTCDLVVCSASSSGSVTPSLMNTPSTSSYNHLPATPSLAYTPSISSFSLLPTPSPTSIRDELPREPGFGEPDDELPPWTRPAPSAWHGLDSLVHRPKITCPGMHSRAGAHPVSHTLDLVPMVISGADVRRAPLPSFNELFQELINQHPCTGAGLEAPHRRKEDAIQLARFGLS